jgi:hypothetical protein
MRASDMILSPLDASRHDDSDDMCFIFVQSLDDEILHFNNLVSGLSQYFWQVSVYNNFQFCNSNHMIYIK